MAACGGHPQCVRPTPPGAGDAYRAVRTRGFRASKVLLYAIEGALMDVHLNDIPVERKEALNRQLDALTARQKN